MIIDLYTLTNRYNHLRDLARQAPLEDKIKLNQIAAGVNRQIQHHKKQARDARMRTTP